MPILIAIAAIAGGIIFWIYRARMAADAANDLAGMAGDVMAAARRLGFRRRHDTHPVDSVEDPNLAAGALTVAFAELGAAQTTDARNSHLVALQHHLDLPRKDAEEVLILGHWLVNECRTPDAAVTRIGKRLFKLGGPQALDLALPVMNEIGQEAGGLSDRQREALHDLGNIFRRR